MLQPFVPMQRVFLERLITMNKVFLVSQSYKRGTNALEEIPRTPLLLTDYDDPGLAKIHLNALRGDRYAALIDLTRPAHKQKLLEMLSPHSSYRLFWSTVASLQKLESEIDKNFREKIHRFVTTRTSWRPPRDETVSSKMEVIFGEIFITLRYRKEKVRVTFDELETI